MPVLPPIPPSTTDRVLDAGAVSRTYRIEDGTVRTVSIRGDQGEVAVAGPELAIVVDGVRYDDGALVLADPPEPGDGTTLSWTVATPDDTVHVTVLVTAWPGSDVIRKSAFVTGAGRLDRIELELWEGVEMRGFASPDRVSPDRAPSGALQGSDPGPGSLGLGQPVHGPGFFAGIEHPGAENLTTAGGCRCSISYGVVLDGLQAVVSPTAVVGSGDFFDYLESIHPHADQVLVVAETRTHPQPPASGDEAAVRRQVHGFGAVTARHGLEIDHFCLGDGWDGGWSEGIDLDDLWARLDPPRFPGGLAVLEEATGRGRVGLWLGPSGGSGARGRVRVEWAAAQGGEIDQEGRLCVAGDCCQEALRQTLTRWTAAGIRYWNLDGASFSCRLPGHGHPSGTVGRTVQMDRFLRVLTDARAVDPGVVIAFGSGSNPSPWWLPAANFLAPDEVGHAGSGTPPGGALESAATLLDARLHRYRRCSVPVSALVGAGATWSAPAPAPAPADWARHCWLTVGRGAQLHDVDLEPDSLSDPEWAVMSEALAWARRHRRVLGRSRMVLGDPSAAEVYGFASRRLDEAVLCLRNPAAVPQSVEVVPADADMFGFDADASLGLTLVFGPTPPPLRVLAGRSLEIELEPFEVLLLTAAANDERPPLLAVVDQP